MTPLGWRCAWARYVWADGSSRRSRNSGNDPDQRVSLPTATGCKPSMTFNSCVGEEERFSPRADAFAGCRSQAINRKSQLLLHAKIFSTALIGRSQPPLQTLYRKLHSSVA